MLSAPANRLAYIDWLRGLACVLMFQTHCYDAWLTGPTRNSTFFMWSQLLGTFPAPLFLLLSGISFAIVTDKLNQKEIPPSRVAKQTIRRGAEVFAFAMLLRLQEFLIALGWAPWSDLFRVDILNIIGVSMMLMGVMCWAVSAGIPGPRHYMNYVAWSLAVAAAISVLAPLLWTNWRLKFLPWELESYIDGVHNLGQPQPGLFPVFPWTAFAFTGLALGFLLRTEFSRKLGWRLLATGAVAGFCFIYIAKFFDRRSWSIYPIYDFWHTSPEFFLMRVGFLMIFVFFAYAWCRWGLGGKSFSPLIQLGNTSLLVYWVHLELVYGKFSILPHRSQGIVGASAGLLAIFLMMLVLSFGRTAWKSRAVLPWVHAIWGRAPRPSGRA